MMVSEYPWYTPSFGEYNEAQSKVVPFLDKDINLAVSFGTAVGKTVLAEGCMAYHLKSDPGCFVSYVCPLKSIASEKYKSWSSDSQLSQYGIRVWKGDGDEGSQDGRIIISTLESFDSRTRSGTLLNFACVVFDEAHVLGDKSRGHAMEASMMRVSSWDRSPRFILLSATLGNVVDVAKWMKFLNGKQTKCFISDWRPTVVDVRIHSEDDYKSMIDLTLSLALDNKDKKTIVFVHSKVVGKEIAKKLKSSGIPTTFHNASLSSSRKAKIEKVFNDSSSGLNVIVSTSTLGMGVNLSADVAIVVGTRRGRESVSCSDLMQLTGRVGRTHGKTGCCAHIISDPSDVVRIEEGIGKNDNNVSSSFNENNIGFHLLPEIASGKIRLSNDVDGWISRSFLRFEDRKINILKSIDWLQSFRSISIGNDGLLAITELGRIASKYYFSPDDLCCWIDSFRKLFEMELQDDDASIACALGSVSVGCVGGFDDGGNVLVMFDEATRQEYRPKENCVVSSALWWCAMGHAPAGKLRNKMLEMRSGIGRVCSVLKAIDRYVEEWNRESFFDDVQDMVKHGIGTNLLPLFKMGFSKGQSIILREYGVKETDDIPDAFASIGDEVDERFREKLRFVSNDILRKSH